MNYELTSGEYAAHPDVNERDHFSFGGGRRIWYPHPHPPPGAVRTSEFEVWLANCFCSPGLHVAERSIFLNLARLLWGFKIEHAKDDNGHIIPVDLPRMVLFLGRCQILFRINAVSLFEMRLIVAITVRSAKRERILRRQWVEAKKVGVNFEDSVQFEKI